MRADLRPVKENLRLKLDLISQILGLSGLIWGFGERVYFGSERVDFRPGRADSGTGGSLSSLERGDLQMYGQIDGWTNERLEIHSSVLQDIAFWGRYPKSWEGEGEEKEKKKKRTRRRERRTRRSVGKN